MRHDVTYVPGRPFFCGTPTPVSMRLPFATYSPKEVRTGLRRLATALR